MHQFNHIRLFLILLLLPLASIAATNAPNGSNNGNQQPYRLYDYRNPTPPTNEVPTPTNNPRAGRNCPIGSQCQTPAAMQKKQPKKVSPLSKQPELKRPASKYMPPLPTAGKKNNHEPKQLLLYFPDTGIANTRIQQIAQKHDLHPSQRTPLNALGGEIVLYISERQPLHQLKKMLSALAPEAVVEFNHYYHTTAGPRQYFSSHIKLTKPLKALATVPIGIVDTNVADIPALKTSTITRRHFSTSSEDKASSAHGTAVALLIAGKDDKNQFYGVAPGSPLYVANIMRKMNRRNNTNALLLAQAIDWLVGKKIKIINLSLGGPSNAIMANIFKKLSNLPILIVAAAGNGGSKAPPSYPAAYPSVLAVTATNANQQVYKHANHGSYIAIAAPGEDVWVPSTSNGEYVSGTSFSAALVSGMVSRLISAHTQVNTNTIKQALCQRAIDLGSTGNDEIYGCGLLQSVAAHP